MEAEVAARLLDRPDAVALQLLANSRIEVVDADHRLAAGGQGLGGSVEADEAGRSRTKHRHLGLCSRTIHNRKPTNCALPIGGLLACPAHSSKRRRCGDRLTAIAFGGGAGLVDRHAGSVSRPRPPYFAHRFRPRGRRPPGLVGIKPTP